MTLKTLEHLASTFRIQMKSEHREMLRGLVGDADIIVGATPSTPELIKKSLCEKNFKILHKNGESDQTWNEEEDTFLGIYEIFDGEKKTYVIAFP